jgi:Zn-dependent M28 family amino/carboxypeptidase
MTAIALVLISLLIAAFGAYHYMLGVPGTPHQGALPALTPDERDLAARLRGHVEAIAKAERNLDHYEELEQAAKYIEGVLEGYGYPVTRQVFTSRGKSVRNIDVVLEAPKKDIDVIVVGAHYDSAQGTPGANDNASGTAAVLELARLLRDLKDNAGKRIRLVLFVNEERPYYGTPEMGSLNYARLLHERGERVTAMYSLETIGYFSDQPGSQRYPAPFGAVFADKGDFISFVGMLNSRPLVQETMRSFRSHTPFPTIGGVSPGFIPGIAWSDHWSFAQYGFQAVMVTDTAPFRYPHYHRPTDTPDKIDYEKLARVVKGMERVIRDLVRNQAVPAPRRTSASQRPSSSER